MSKNQGKTLLSPFSGAYWRAAAEELKNIRVLVLMAVLVAISIVVSGFYIPVAQNLRIYFSFIVSTVYQWLGYFDIAPVVTQDAVLQLVTAVLQVLSLLGLIVDPTTAGVADSQRALGYEEPYQQEKVKPPEDKMNEVE